jgi:hypothetical protein
MAGLRASVRKPTNVLQAHAMTQGRSGSDGVGAVKTERWSVYRGYDRDDSFCSALSLANMSDRFRDRARRILRSQTEREIKSGQLRDRSQQDLRSVA